MMRLNSFWGLVEIQTKLASIIPFSLGSLYALYHFQRFNIRNFILLLISLIAFDMVTTALNNYFDYKRAIKKYGYNYESHNAIVRDQLKESVVVTVITVLLVVATLFGILLVLNTNLIVLLVGMLSFAVGICYSFGPVPISRTPLGELLSGLFMGFVIVFLSVYVHVYDQNIVTLLFVYPLVTFQVQMLEVIFIFLLSIPAVCGIANIMLANNICDIEDDIENRRYTLPVYIGKGHALGLFKSLYFVAYLDILVLAVLRVLPVISLLVLLTWIPVRKNIHVFKLRQTKKDTFALSVQNFMMIVVAQTILLGAAMLLRLFL